MLNGVGCFIPNDIFLSRISVSSFRFADLLLRICKIPSHEKCFANKIDSDSVFSSIVPPKFGIQVTYILK